MGSHVDGRRCRSHWEVLANESIGLSRMADNSGAKRLKSSDDGVPAVVENAELRRRNAELRRRNAELESEIVQLRRGGRREGNHEVLPVVTEVIVIASTAVDLSRLDMGLVTHISSFLGTPRELLSIALTCKSFGWRQPTSALNWSLMEEVARQTVCSRATDDEMSSLPRYVSGTATWLAILHRHEHPVLFDVLLGRYIQHRNGDKTKVFGPVGEDRGTYEYNVAVSSSYVMRSGAHYAEFKITGEPYIGVVRPMPGLDAGAYPEDFSFFNPRFYSDFLAQKSADWGGGNVHACDYYCEDGEKRWNNWRGADQGWALWEQWEGMEGCGAGDTLGMLLNLDEGTLSVYKNNRRLGVMKDGLSGAYCWYASVSDDDTVEISKAVVPQTTVQQIEQP